MAEPKYDAEKLAELITRPRSTRELAQILGVSQPTIVQWMKKPETHQALEEAVLSAARIKIINMTDSSLKTLQTLINKGNVKAVAMQLQMAGLMDQAEVKSSNSLTVIVPTGIQVPEKVIEVESADITERSEADQGV